MNLNENNDNLNHHECVLNGKALGIVEEYKHICVTRYCNLKIANKCLVEERINLGKTYSLCSNGCRLPRNNRLNPKVTKTIYNIYVFPRLLYFTFGPLRSWEIRKYFRFRFIYSKQFKSFEPHLDLYQSLYDLFAET